MRPIQEALTFDDVLIKPNYSDISSRKDIDLSVNMGDFLRFNLPILSANMDTITGVDMASTMSQQGGLGVLHRFWSIEDNVKALFKVWDNFGHCGVSIGLGSHERERAQALYDHGALIFVLDVAHGAQRQVVDQYKWLKDNLPSIVVVVGNFATKESVCDFILGRQDSLGRNISNGSGFTHINQFEDYIKVGIGPGSACTTRIKTGVGVPQLSAIMDIAQLGVKIVADGGMRTPGDIAKALAAGADLVMLGGMLSATKESPPGVRWFQGMEPEHGSPSSLTYRGSASKESYDVQGKDQSYITAEGEAFTVPYKGSVKSVLNDIAGGLRSALSYVGARNLKEFREKATFVKVTNAGRVESLPHGKKG